MFHHIIKLILAAGFVAAFASAALAFKSEYAGGPIQIIDSRTIHIYTVQGRPPYQIVRISQNDFSIIDARWAGASLQVSLANTTDPRRDELCLYTEPTVYTVIKRGR